MSEDKKKQGTKVILWGNMPGAVAETKVVDAKTLETTRSNYIWRNITEAQKKNDLLSSFIEELNQTTESKSDNLVPITGLHQRVPVRPRISRRLRLNNANNKKLDLQKESLLAKLLEETTPLDTQLQSSPPINPNPSVNDDFKQVLHISEPLETTDRAILEQQELAEREKILRSQITQEESLLSNSLGRQRLEAEEQIVREKRIKEEVVQLEKIRIKELEALEKLERKQLQQFQKEKFRYMQQQLEQLSRKKPLTFWELEEQVLKALKKLLEIFTQQLNQYDSQEYLKKQALQADINILENKIQIINTAIATQAKIYTAEPLNEFLKKQLIDYKVIEPDILKQYLEQYDKMQGSNKKVEARQNVHTKKLTSLNTSVKHELLSEEANIQQELKKNILAALNLLLKTLQTEYAIYPKTIVTLSHEERKKYSKLNKDINNLKIILKDIEDNIYQDKKLVNTGVDYLTQYIKFMKTLLLGRMIEPKILENYLNIFLKDNINRENAQISKMIKELQEEICKINEPNLPSVTTGRTVRHVKKHH